MAAPAVLKTIGSSSISRGGAWATSRSDLLRTLMTPKQSQEPAAEHREEAADQKTPKHTFTLHLGGDLELQWENKPIELQQHQPQQLTAAQKAELDPFAGLPFRGFAERLGTHFEPVAKAIQDEHKQSRAAARATFAATSALPDAIPVPSLLPITKWAAHNPTVRSTLVADDPTTRKRARLSWYHPDDTMVPRNWFSGGLLEDLRYYNPFNLGAFVTPKQQ